MVNAVSWVFSVIDSSVDWLLTFTYAGVPFLYWLIALALMGIIIRGIL